MSDEGCEFYIVNKKQERFTVLVDKEDLLRLIELDKSWYVAWQKNIKSYYITRNIYDPESKKRRVIYLHDWIYDFPTNKVVDHINHNPFDNRKENLRIANTFENLRNRQSKNSNNTSGYRNISWRPKIKLWLVQLMGNDKKRIRKYFNNKNDAIKYTEQKRKEIYGDYSGNSCNTKFRIKF